MRNLFIQNWSRIWKRIDWNCCMYIVCALWLGVFYLNAPWGVIITFSTQVFVPLTFHQRTRHFLIYLPVFQTGDSARRVLCPSEPGRRFDCESPNIILVGNETFTHRTKGFRKTPLTSQHDWCLSAHIFPAIIKYFFYYCKRQSSSISALMCGLLKK